MAGQLSPVNELKRAISPTAEIIEEAREGRMFILVDAEDRENEGDLIIPAQFATPVPGFDTRMTCEAGSPTMTSFGPWTATSSIGSSTLNVVACDELNLTLATVASWPRSLGIIRTRIVCSSPGASAANSQVK